MIVGRPYGLGAFGTVYRGTMFNIPVAWPGIKHISPGIKHISPGIKHIYAWYQTQLCPVSNTSLPVSYTSLPGIKHISTRYQTHLFNE